MVSNRSPSQKEAAKHYTTLAPMERKEVDRYLEEKGYRIGRSSFRQVEAGYKPQEGERWWKCEEEECSLYDEAPNDDRWVETIEEEGLCNKYQLRDQLNVIYFLDLEKSMPAWPWAFKRKVTNVGFF